MGWEKPEIVEISLACEISSYANAELGDFQEDRARNARSESGR